MHSLKLRAPEPEPVFRPGRGRKGRKQLLRALRVGLLLQGLLTTGALLLTALLGAPLAQAGGPTFILTTIPDLLAPSWLAGLFIGYATPRLRWWHPASAGLVAAGFFWMVTSLPAVWAAVQAARLWVAANLVIAPLIAGWIGHRFRDRRAG